MQQLESLLEPGSMTTLAQFCQHCTFLFRVPRSHPIQFVSSPDGHCSHQIQSISDGGSAPRDDLYSPICQRRSGHLDEPQRQRTLSRTPSPRQPSGKDNRNQLSPYNVTFLQLEQTAGSSGQRGTGPPTEPGFSQGFFSILSPMEFWFLAAVAPGLLSWVHLISS